MTKPGGASNEKERREGMKKEENGLSQKEKLALRKLRREAEVRRGWAAVRQAEALLAACETQETGQA
jgi:hypothetical protein